MVVVVVRNWKTTRYELSFECPQRFLGGLAFGLAHAEGEDGRGVVGLLGDGDAVEGAVQLAVAGAVELVALLAAGGGVERRDARLHGELGVRAEALDTGHLTDQPAVSAPQPGSGSSCGGPHRRSGLSADNAQGLCHAPIRPRRRSSGGGGRHNGRKSGPQALTAETRVSPPPARAPTRRVGHHRPTRPH
jgi:hypothetical protein